MTMLNLNPKYNDVSPFFKIWSYKSNSKENINHEMNLRYHDYLINLTPNDSHSVESKMIVILLGV